MIKIQDNTYFSDNRNDMDLQMIFKFLKNTYWAKSRSFEEQKLAIESSLNFGLFKNNHKDSFCVANCS